MERALSIFAFALAALLGCATATDPPGNCPSGWVRFIGALEGAPVPACTETAANAMPQSTGPATPCPAPAGDACASCVAMACCAEASALVDEMGCGCLIGCRATGGTLAGCSVSCAAQPDDLCNTAGTCVSTHCAAQCPRLP